VTVFVIWKIEVIGRRTLLLSGMATIASGLLLLTIAFEATRATPGTTEASTTGQGFGLALPGVLLVVCGYSISFGPLTWLLTSELFPTEIRGRALGASTIVTYLCAALVTSSFLSLQAAFGTSVVFAAYLLVTCLGFFFALMAIPDTKEKTPAEIEHEMSKMLWWKGRLDSARDDTLPLVVDDNDCDRQSPNDPSVIRELEMT
jgi:SP family arabinose:H+ symporter-like MFS transporter